MLPSPDQPKITSCLICFAPFNVTKWITLPCQCTCCHSCLTDWIVLKIREPSFSLHKTFTCFSERCPGTFQIQAVSSQLPQSNQEQIDRELLNSYLIRTSDIRKCPNINCSYAGIIDSSLVKCSQPLNCEACGRTWNDPLCFPHTEKLLAITTINEAFSSLWKGLWTKRCPGCQRPIQKNGGCPHMKCSYCEINFCWICQGDHKFLAHTYHSMLSCLPIFLLLLIALSAIYQVPMVHSFVNPVVNDMIRFVEREYWSIIGFIFLSGFCVIVQISAIGFVLALGYFLYQTWTNGPKKLLFRPTELLGMIIVNLCSVVILSR